MGGLLDNLGPIMPIIGAAGGAALGGAPGAMIGGGIGGSIGQMIGQKEANQQNAEIAQNQMNFQERMSDTAHQREVTDLQAAGLNPILSANSGASTPTGATATMQNTMAGLGSTAMDIVKNVQALKESQASIAKIQQDTDTSSSQEDLNNALSQKAAIDAKVNSEGIPEADMKNKIYNWIQNKYQEVTRSAAPKQQPFSVHGYDPKTQKFDIRMDKP